MKKHTLAAAMAAVFTCSGGASAGTIDDELAAIKARLKQLEQHVHAQNEVIREKDRQIEALVSNPQIREQREGGGGWFQRVEISGVLEVEAGYNDPDSGGSSSDISLATAELGIAAQINDWVAGEITLLYEEDDTDLEVDVATITIADPDGPWFVSAGQQYVPFGTYETNLVSDPLTLEIGETRETAIVGGIESGGFVGGLYVFNGDLARRGEDQIDAFGAFAGFSHEGENHGFAVNLGYISDIGDADGLQDTIQDNINIAVVDYDDHVAGVTLDAKVTTGPFTFIAEYTTAVDSFQANELAFNAAGAQPSAFNIEAGYSFTLVGRDATVAVAYQETDEAVALGLPEKRVAVALSVDVMENTALSFEWAHDDDYSAADGGTGASGGDTVTAQLAVEF
ncbi:MAG: LbtU family siderophore porin [Chromatiaceae bacterium]|nr:LbtU family siderophore porin [Chromatiaceae bacterium]MCP5438618.1 LbtU family siderophore porin [Chromatiaceae bacterium]MCP5440587.1 LbtU family siderophore porin [Chromatiaceae bacterium]HPE78593.1 LbtU family siderophore porin [Gammaproteobacteria bacterium]